MNAPRRRGERWRRAKKFKQGVRFRVEVYIPIGNARGRRKTLTKEDVVKAINPSIEKFKQAIRNLDGIPKIYQDV